MIDLVLYMEFGLIQMLLTSLNFLMVNCLEEHLGFWLGYNCITSRTLTRLKCLYRLVLVDNKVVGLLSALLV